MMTTERTSVGNDELHKLLNDAAARIAVAVAALERQPEDIPLLNGCEINAREALEAIEAAAKLTRKLHP